MNQPAKVLIYDIEATGLNADWDTMLCLGYEWYGTNKPKIVSLMDTNEQCKGCGRLDTLSDSTLVAKTREILLQADLLVSWYGREGRGFDSRFVNARILAAGLEPLPRIPQVDLWCTMRDRFKLRSNRLANVQGFLKLAESKTPLDQHQWRAARAGDPKALRYIVDHCKQDVKVLRETYTILRPWVTTHPRVGKWGACDVCGGNLRIREGRWLGRTKTEQIRVQCRECSHWQTAVPTFKEGG